MIMKDTNDVATATPVEVICIPGARAAPAAEKRKNRQYCNQNDQCLTGACGDDGRDARCVPLSACGSLWNVLGHAPWKKPKMVPIECTIPSKSDSMRMIFGKSVSVLVTTVFVLFNI